MERQGPHIPEARRPTSEYSAFKESSLLALDDAARYGFVLPSVVIRYFEEFPHDLHEALDVLQDKLSLTDPSKALIEYRIGKLKEAFALPLPEGQQPQEQQ